LGPAHAAAVARLMDLKFNGFWAGQRQGAVLAHRPIDPQALLGAPFGAREAGFPGLPEIGQAGERPARSSLFDTVARMVKVQAGSNWETFFAGYGRHGR
jgi:hypothetical protein